MQNMKPPRVFYGWWIVVASIFGLIVCNGPFVYTMSVFMPSLINEFGWGRGDISLSLTFHTLANAAAMPIAGKLVDRFGARRVLLPAILVWGIGVGLISVIPGALWALYAMFFVLGIATSGATPLPYGRMISAWFNQRRGLALGLAMSGTGLGTLIIPILAQRLIDTFDWRMAFAGIGALILVVAVVIVIPIVRDTPEEMGSSPDNLPADQDFDGEDQTTVPGFSSTAVLKQRQFWLITAAFSIVAMTVLGTAAHLFPLLVDSGIEPTTAAMGVSTMGLALLLSRVWAGYLLDRYFAPYVAIGFICGPILGCLLFASGVTGSLAFVAAIGIGLGIGAEIDMIAYFIGRYFGLRSFGVLYGYLFGAFLVGGGIGPPLLGYGYDILGTYAAPLYMCAVAAAVACLLLAILGPYPKSFDEDPLARHEQAN
jgi:MFS family permease